MRTAVKRVGAISAGVIAAGVVAALFVVYAIDLVDFLPSPFKRESVDRSQPALLERLSDLSEYRAASAELQVVIDVEEDIRFLPSFVAGERVTFLAGGSVDGAVDFGSLGDDAVEIDGDALTITLPAAEIVDVDVDPDRSYVVNRDRGILDRIGGIFSDNPTGERELYQLAEVKLRAAADDSAVRQRAERNTRRMLEALMRSLGFEKVTVVFEEPPAT